MSSQQSLFPSINLTEFDNYAWPEDVLKVKNEVEEKWFKPYNQELPGYVLLAFRNASEATGMARFELIDKAENSAYTQYLALRAKGKIKLKSDEPMPEEVKQQLRELNQSRRELKKAKEAQFKSIIVKTPKVKQPVYADVGRQAELVKKYKWAVVGSFKPDAVNSKLTIVDIKCEKCGAIRTIHLPELFQIKLCTFCKDKNGKKSKHSGKRRS